MMLDTTSFANAVQRLREGLARHRREPLDEQLRDGLIHRFELTYELAHTVLRRHLREVSAPPNDIEHLSVAELARIGNAQDLLTGEWPAWRRFREIRDRTSQAYGADTAAAVIAAIPDFLREVEYLLAELQRRG
jgi:nucleotidyltransferase substrate binding protein (TIGR01987 family)